MNNNMTFLKYTVNVSLGKLDEFDILDNVPYKFIKNRDFDDCIYGMTIELKTESKDTERKHAKFKIKIHDTYEIEFDRIWNAYSPFDKWFYYLSYTRYNVKFLK